MSRERAVAALEGRGPTIAYAISWVPDTVLAALLWRDSGIDAAETLAAGAAAIGADLAFVPADAEWAADAVRLLHLADVAAAWTVSGVLGRAARRRGWNDVIARSATEPGALAFELSDALHGALVDSRAALRARPDAIVVADDLAGGSGWLVAPDFTLEALVPCYRQIASEADVPVVFHSDGDVRALYPALASAGYSAVHIAVSGEIAIERAVSAARDAGLVPMGGIESAALLTASATEAGKRAASLAGDDALVVCDDGGICAAEQIAAYSTALRAAKAAVGAL